MEGYLPPNLPHPENRCTTKMIFNRGDAWSATLYASVVRRRGRSAVDIDMIIGLVANVFTAVLFTRMIYDFMLSRGRVEKLSI